MTELFVYNNFINGDWKRQHYYKPSPERMSQIALYEWEHDAGFNDILGTSQSRVDLAGVFEKCPVPTLILEGRWDLTWNIDKPEILLQNHPGAKLVMFERSGHGIYDEEPDKFFKVVKEFIKSLPEASETKIALYKKEIEEWHQKIAAAPRSMFASLGWGRSSNEKIAAMYSQERFEEIRSALELSDFLKIGFALYDVARYEDALSVFEKMAGVFAAKGENEHLGLALIWQGHMLDLLGRRREAITAYKQVAEMNIKGAWRHDQFGLKYELSPYAKERMSVPFKRVENRSLD
jgi:tetratricopeptide (TPR) repeat protein